MKVAKLVSVSLMTRVIVDADASDSDIIELAYVRLSEKLANEPLEHLDEIVDDTECPFGTFDDDNE